MQEIFTRDEVIEALQNAKLLKAMAHQANSTNPNKWDNMHMLCAVALGVTITMSMLFKVYDYLIE